MRTDKTVIIIARPTDVHAVAVAAEVGATFKSRALILNSAQYPNAWRITMDVSQNSEPTWTVRGDGWEVTSDQLTGVWWRRPYRHRIASEVKGRKVRRFCEDEAKAAFLGWIHGLGQKVMNPFSADFAANQKPLQLLRAREVGLKIPHTVVTNDAEEARTFLKRRDGSTIFKVLTGTSWQFTETRRFRSAHLRHLKNLRYAPVIFQELVEAQSDIRVTIVDQTAFAVSIKPILKGAKFDWRMDLASEIRPHVLPGEIRRGLIKLMRVLGLRFGAIDLRLTPANEYVFLEVNPGGQFLFCEIHGGHPISRAIAAALLKDRKPS